MNAFAALLWEKHGNTWYATRGYYYSGRDKGITKTDQEYSVDLDKLIEDIMKPREEAYKKGLSEYMRKMKTIVDPSAASFITLLQRKNWYAVIHADNDVIDGIRDTATAMILGRIKISPKITDWRKEAEGYVWDSSSVEDRPVKVNDHFMDSTRYLVKTMNLAKQQRVL